MASAAVRDHRPLCPNGERCTLAGGRCLMVAHRGPVPNRLVIGTLVIAVSLLAVWLIAPEVTLVGLFLFAVVAELVLYGVMYVIVRRHW
jgi:hypothetical protein